MLSCLGSWSNLRHLRPHQSERWGTYLSDAVWTDYDHTGEYLPDLPEPLGCRLCGFGDILSRGLDLRSLELERLDGSYRSGSIVYWLYDAFRVVQDGAPRVRSQDIDALRRLLGDLDACSQRRGATFKRTDAVREIRASHKQAGLPLRKEAAERILNSLGASGVLGARSLLTPYDGHVPLEVRIRSGRSYGTYDYPFNQWTGADGVDFQRFEELLAAAELGGSPPRQEHP